ncbi:Abi family protein, partial [Prevotella corporis]|uniref:Abi family protein n=1 Tax=Prevotella corporis TaxID=28128 RepID=UPI003FF00084
KSQSLQGTVQGSNGYSFLPLQAYEIMCMRGEGCNWVLRLTRYFFDKELRLILFDAIEAIEIALRTKMIYHLSQSYGGLYYMDKGLFNNEELQQQHIHDLMGEFMRSSEIFIKDYKCKYGVWEDRKCISLTQQPDAWIIFEVATFGTLSKIYKNLNHQLPEKARIANEFGLNMHTELSSWLEAISYLRNIVAHHSRVWSRNMVKRPMDISNPRGIWLQHPLSEFSKKKPFLIITSMLYLCNAINAGDTYKRKTISLIEKNPDIPIYKITLVRRI